MTDSDPPRLSKSDLCLNIQRINTLWSAWIAIRPKALRSSDQQTRASANVIDENPYSALRGLQDRLRSGTFKFEPQRGVLKKRKDNKPRPLVISPITNRIVQRAILDTLQSKKASVRRRLGSISEVLYTPTSVGGIPEKGSSDAVKLIRAAITDGATHYVRSDIRDFFTNVKTAQLISTIENITGDGEFAEFLKDGLQVELSNADEPWVQEWIDLFPDGHTGVPQGSSLSTFCANFVLAGFDNALNRNGLTTIRYIDDFVILGRSEKATNRGWKTAKSILSQLELQVHEPSDESKKASLGQVSDGFEFLSYRFRGKCVGLAKAAKLSILDKIDEEILSSKRSIAGSLAEKRRAEARFAQSLVSIDRRVRGWGDSFQDVDQRVEFKQLDEKIASKIRGFLGWYSRQISGRDAQEKMRALGVALLYDTPRPDTPNV